MNINDIIITDLKICATNVMPKGTFYCKDRQCCALLICQTGQMVYKMNDKKFLLSPTNALILPTGSNYSYTINNQCIVNVVNFSASNFSCDEILSFSVGNHYQFIENFEKIKTLSTFSENRLTVMGILYKILASLQNASSSENNILLPAIQYLEKNIFSSELTNSVLADEANISEVHFRKLFYELYNTTPKQYILEVRLNKAKQLLGASKQSVTEIAYSCGFSSLYSFSRAFKERVGITPTEYHKTHYNLFA